jgi:plasmid stability protein
VNRNLTLNLPEPLIRRLRIVAAHRDLSMNALAREAIERAVTEDPEADRAQQRLIARVRNARDTGLKGKASWTRAQLHER